LKLKGDVSRMSVTGSLHVSPPFVDLLTRTAFVKSFWANEMAIWYAEPLGANVTHGSEVRSKSPPFATVPPEQRLKCAHEWAHVAPPSWLTAATSPCAPPSFQRSCW
jgi:hypothetical protein